MLRCYAREVLGRRISSVRALAVSLFMLVPIPIPILSLVATCLGDSGFLPPQKHDFKGISMGQHVPRGPTSQLSNNCTRNCPKIRANNWHSRMGMGMGMGKWLLSSDYDSTPASHSRPTSSYLPCISTSINNTCSIAYQSKKEISEFLNENLL